MREIGSRLEGFDQSDLEIIVLDFRLAGLKAFGTGEGDGDGRPARRQGSPQPSQPAASAAIIGMSQMTETRWRTCKAGFSEPVQNLFRTLGKASGIRGYNSFGPI